MATHSINLQGALATVERELCKRATTQTREALRAAALIDCFPPRFRALFLDQTEKLANFLHQRGVGTMAAPVKISRQEGGLTMAIPLRKMKQKQIEQETRAGAAAMVPKADADGWVTMPVLVHQRSLVYAHAIAAAMTADCPEERPMTITDVLQLAIEDGMEVNKEDILDIDVGDPVGSGSPMQIPAPVRALLAAAISDLGFGKMPPTNFELRRQVSEYKSAAGGATPKEQQA
jgi:hypothetical protein